MTYLMCDHEAILLFQLNLHYPQKVTLRNTTLDDFVLLVKIVGRFWPRCAFIFQPPIITHLDDLTASVFGLYFENQIYSGQCSCPTSKGIL